MKELLTPEQLKSIDLFVKNPIEKPPLVIIAKSDFKRKAVIEYICSKYDWQITWGLDLLSDIINYKTANKLPELEEKIMNQSALVIDELDYFKCDNTIQHHLASIIYKYNNPIVLTLKDKNIFSNDIKEIIDNSIMVKISQKNY